MDTPEDFTVVSELTVCTICIDHCVEQGILPKEQEAVARSILKKIGMTRHNYHLASELEEEDTESPRWETVSLPLSAAKTKE